MFITPCPHREKASAFDAWVMYSACALHFKKENKYDAFKFNFKGPRCKRETFESHRQRYVFEKCANTYKTKNDLLEYYLANFLQGNTWIGSMNNAVYESWCARIQSMAYRFKEEILNMSNSGIHFDTYFEYDGAMPKIYNLYAGGKISIETLTILDILVGYACRINKNVSDPLGIVGDISHLVIAYKPFLRPLVDVKKYREIVYNLFTSVNI